MSKYHPVRYCWECDRDCDVALSNTACDSFYPREEENPEATLEDIVEEVEANHLEKCPSGGDHDLIWIPCSNDTSLGYCKYCWAYGYSGYGEDFTFQGTLSNNQIEELNRAGSDEKDMPNSPCYNPVANAYEDYDWTIVPVTNDVEMGYHE